MLRNIYFVKYSYRTAVKNSRSIFLPHPHFHSWVCIVCFLLSREKRQDNSGYRLAAIGSLDSKVNSLPHCDLI